MVWRGAVVFRSMGEGERVGARMKDTSNILMELPLTAAYQERMSRCTRIYIKSGGTPLTAALRMCKPHPIDDRMYVIAWPGDLNEQGHYNFTSTAALHKQRAGALLEFTSTADSSPKQQQVQDDQSPSTAASPPRICATISIPCLSYLHMPSQLR